jgi:hypothetical protein
MAAPGAGRMGGTATLLRCSPRRDLALPVHLFVQRMVRHTDLAPAFRLGLGHDLSSFALRSPPSAMVGNPFSHTSRRPHLTTVNLVQRTGLWSRVPVFLKRCGINTNLSNAEGYGPVQLVFLRQHVRYHPSSPVPEAVAFLVRSAYPLRTLSPEVRYAASIWRAHGCLLVALYRFPDNGVASVGRRTRASRVGARRRQNTCCAGHDEGAAD